MTCKDRFKGHLRGPQKHACSVVCLAGAHLAARARRFASLKQGLIERQLRRLARLVVCETNCSQRRNISIFFSHRVMLTM